MALTSTVSYTTSTGFTVDTALVSFEGSLAQLRHYETTPSLTLTNMTFSTATSAVTKTGGTNNVFDAQAVSVADVIASSGFVQFKASQTNSSFIMGLSADNPDASNTGIDYGILCFNNGNALIHENGVEMTNTGAYTINDVFRVEVSGGSVVYKKNGTTLYTSLVTPSFPLFMDSSFAQSNAAANSIVMNLSNTNATKYSIANPSILQQSSIFTDAISAFTSTSSVSGSDLVKFAVNVDGTDKYHNGTGWTISSGYTQSNTPAEMASNIASLGLTGGADILLKAYLHSDTGATSPQLTSAVLSYDFAVEQPTDTNKCIVYAFLKDFYDVPLSNTTHGAQLIVENPRSFQKGGFLIGQMKRAFNFDVNGYVEAELEESASVSKNYKFSIEYTDAYDSSKKQIIVLNDGAVPNTLSASLLSITSVY